MSGILGFRRADGRVGTRNHLLVLSVTGLTGPTGRRIASLLHGAIYAGTPYGSGLLGEDGAAHRRAHSAQRVGDRNAVTGHCRAVQTDL